MLSNVNYLTDHANVNKDLDINANLNNHFLLINTSLIVNKKGIRFFN